MDNRFRFRFWNEDKKEFDNWIGDWPNSINEFFEWHDGIYVIEQCTGLKDKNGKIIYENDIVKNGKEIAEVLWNKNGCFELVGKCFVAPTYLTNLKNWEIIGNIHQDSHLLLEDK